MRLPNAWNDKRLLDDEPFVTAFKPHINQNISNEWKSGVIDDLKKVKSIDHIVASWISRAFVSEAPQKHCQPVLRGAEGIRLFFEFYYNLSYGEEKARWVLNEARLRHGWKILTPSLTSRKSLPISSKPMKKELPNNFVADKVVTAANPTRLKSQKPLPKTLRTANNPPSRHCAEDRPTFSKPGASQHVSGKEAADQGLSQDAESSRMHNTTKKTHGDELLLEKTPRKRPASRSIERDAKRQHTGKIKGLTSDVNLPTQRETEHQSCIARSSAAHLSSNNRQISSQEKRKDPSRTRPKVALPSPCSKPMANLAAKRRNGPVNAQIARAASSSLQVKKESNKSTASSSNNGHISSLAAQNAINARKNRQEMSFDEQFIKRRSTRTLQGRIIIEESSTSRKRKYCNTQSAVTDTKTKRVRLPKNNTAKNERSSPRIPQNDNLVTKTAMKASVISEHSLTPSAKQVLPLCEPQIVPSPEGTPSCQTPIESSTTLLHTDDRHQWNVMLTNRTSKAEVTTVAKVEKSLHRPPNLDLSAKTLTNIKTEQPIPIIDAINSPQATPYLDSGVSPADNSMESEAEHITEFSSPPPPFLPPISIDVQDIKPQSPRPSLECIPPPSPTDCSAFACEDTKPMLLVSETLYKLESDQITHPLLHRSTEYIPSVPMKPTLTDLPPIWAQSRQEICESFDWFRSYQGGVYHVHDYVKGYLLSGFPSSRDRFEHGGKLIISHGGGKAECLHSTKGSISSVPASDQLAADKSVRALLNNYQNNRPLALLIDDKYALFPYDLGSKDVAYAVLGFYTVAYAWAEYQTASNDYGRVVRYKFAFRWCEEQGEPWWIPRPESEELASQSNRKSPSLSSIKASKRPKFPQKQDKEELPDGPVKGVYTTSRCDCCYKESPKVFSLCWACLNPECARFWRQTQAQGPTRYLPEHLEYEPRFLQLPPHKPIPLGFESIEPPMPIEISATGTVTDYHFTRGFHCIRCGRLSCRSQWEQWQCLSCGTLMRTTIAVRDASNIANQTLPIIFNDYLINEIADMTTSPLISFHQEDGRGYMQSFILPEGRGKIHHIQARNQSGRKYADAIFKDYQVQAASGVLKFRRWPMRAHKCRGALLTNYFSHNAGEPYKYVGGDANTVPFDCAPAVCKARDLIQKRIKEAIGISAQFNEVLSAAYMERQRMAFHSDNEVGLGPLVAGLSLGSPALMHFRIHARHDPQREQRGILLSIVLRHGDVLVMDGAGVQEYYEHTVVPNNFRIAATARQIGSTHA